MTKATAGGGPPSIYRVDMPCEEAGFSRPPFDVHLKVLPALAAGGDWTLLAHSSTGTADVMAGWLARQTRLEHVRFAPGPAPNVFRATMPALPALWSTVASLVKVHHLDLEADGLAAWFVECTRDQVHALKERLELAVEPGAKAARAEIRWHALPRRSRPVLSRRQFEALSTAVAMGNYELPHHVDLRRLGAAIAGVGRAFDTLKAKLSESRKAQRASAAALKQSEERFRSLADAASEGILIHDGVHIVDCNRAAARIFGYPEGELEGRPIMDLVAPRSRAIVRAHVSAASPEAYELMGMRKGGKEIPLEATGKTFAWGTGTARVVTLREMTRQRQFEHRFQDLVEAAPDAMVIVDGQSRIIIVNAETERMFGYARAELLGQPVELLVPEGTREPHAAQREGYIAHPVKRPMGKGRALSARRKDGTTFPVEISLSPVGSEEDLRVIATVRDISERLSIERERMEAASRRRDFEVLKAADRVKTTFINTAAHELRTPLMPLRTQIHVLLKGMPREDQRAPLEIAQRNLKRLSTLVEDLLLVSKAQAGHLILKSTTADLGKLVTEAVASYAEVARERGIALDIGDLAPVQLHVDELRITQVLTNFLANALKFTSAGGRVTVSVEDREDAVRVTVTDEGIGISPENLARLFEPFVQVHEGKEVSDPGTGLGLYISRQIIELHGGLVGASSLGEGHGATFWFELPKSPPDADQGSGSDHSPDGIGDFGEGR